MQKGYNQLKSNQNCLTFLKNKISPKVILFLQETHSSLEIEKKWAGDCKDKIYYSHGKTNSCGVLIAVYGNLNICVKNKVNDNDGKVLILEATIDGSYYRLVNLYNANAERKQLTTIKNLNNLLKDFENFHDKNVIFAGDFNVSFGKNPFSKSIVYPSLLN